jgi:hypothetical protein
MSSSQRLSKDLPIPLVRRESQLLREQLGLASMKLLKPKERE